MNDDMGEAQHQPSMADVAAAAGGPVDHRLAELHERMLSPGRFQGKSVVVTGAAQGIGKEVARRIAREGGSVVVADRAAGPAEETVAELISAGLSARASVHDLSSWAGASSLVEDVVATEGRIDVLVNNVGGTIWMKPFLEYQPDEIEAEVSRNFWPTMWCCRAALPGMVERGSGSIVNIASNALRGIYRVPYGASKAGVIGLTTSLAVEVAKSGVRINCVAPGGTLVENRPTPRNTSPIADPRAEQYAREVGEFAMSRMPMSRIGLPGEQAAAIAFLASDEASFITGQVLSVAGGSSPL